MLRNSAFGPEIEFAGQISTGKGVVPLTYLRLGLGTRTCNFDLVFGRFPAELGPETRSNGSGSKKGAERNQH